MLADDLLGHGAGENSREANLANYAKATSALIAGMVGSAGEDGVHLVGHSMADAVIIEVAERLSEQVPIKRLTATVPALPFYARELWIGSWQGPPLALGTDRRLELLTHGWISPTP